MTTGRRGLVGRLLARRHAFGAIAAQLTQAVGSFVLQVVAARELGASGLGLFALLFGLIVVATAISTGLVGDSLTVLDRHEPSVRSALFYLAWCLPLLAGAVAFAATAIVTDLGFATALGFGLATTAYLMEDLVRRLLMAALVFWRVAWVDLSAIVVALGTLLATHLLDGALSLPVFLLALAAGQLAGLLVGAALLPAAERQRVLLRGADLGRVLAFGGWRAAQQLVRPSMLTAARALLLALAGAAALGRVEAARVYLAPAMLVVQGIGSYLLASYARDKGHSTRALLRRADTASGTLLVMSAAAGVVGVLLAPALSSVITKGRFDLEPIAVAGWAAYAASTAAVMPFASLAAIRGFQARVVSLRVLDSVTSLVLLVVALQLLDLSPSWAPWCLAAGSFLGGAFCRTWVLVPAVRRESATGDVPDE